MINTEPGKRLGRIYIPKHYNEAQISAITTHLLLVLDSMEHRTYNWEIIGTSHMFDKLKDMESVPTYDLKIHWVSNAARVRKIDLQRIGRR
jgi:hypothetical protein